MELTSAINFLINLAWIIVLLLVPGKLYTLNLLFEIYFVLYALKSIIYFFAIYNTKYLTGNYKASEFKTRGKEMILESLPFYYLTILSIVSNQIPVLFLEYRSGVEQVGFFNIANKLLTPMGLVLNTALISLFPNLARIYVSDNALFKKRVQSIFIVISTLGIMGAFAITFFRSEAVYLIYGKKYLNASLVLSYQCWYTCIYALVCLIGTLLGAIDKQKQLSYLSIVCTVIQVPILWFGSKYGAEYLSAAFVVATAISLMLHAYVINRFLHESLKAWFFIRIFAFIIAAYTISVLIPTQLNLYMKSTIFLLICGVGALVLWKKYQTIKQ
jgi:O-antigen/teichoic acid export membrane protein